MLAIAIVAGVAVAWWNRAHADADGPIYRTVVVTRGDVAETVTATGTVEPRDVVDVGAQVAGIIVSFGKDPDHPDQTIDYRSHVNLGTVLCQIDPTLYLADVETAKAALAQAKATLEKNIATLAELRAKVKQTSNDWKRAQDAKNSIADTDYDAAEDNYEAATAELAMGQADVDEGKAGVASAQATLDRANENLGYCTVTSPVKGVIIDRRVNIGETVVSSLSAPSLFLIAKDLSRVQVWASVNEADIGKISPGQVATFKVDAYPERVFQGTVNKIRLNAQMTQNVVTYTVEIDTDNSDQKLLPYMTAHITFHVQDEKNVLCVPNGALRWTPQENSMQTIPLQGSQGVLWIPGGRGVQPIRVDVGVTDGINTVVSGDDVKEGMDVVDGEQLNAGGNQMSNPLVPQFGKKQQN